MVYVDEIFDTTGFKNPKWRFNEACHMYADSLDELIEFGAKIGMKESWLHKAKDFIHFDLTRGKRHQAIKAGAKPVTCREMVELKNAQLR